MTRSGRQLLERALKLSAAERVKLARDILESVEDSDLDADAETLSPAWRAEIERRLADEPSPGKPWPTGEEVIARLRLGLEKSRSRKKRRGS